MGQPAVGTDVRFDGDEGLLGDVLGERVIGDAGSDRTVGEPEPVGQLQQ